MTTEPASVNAVAPPVQTLPAAPTVKVVHVTRPEDDYAYVDQAYAMSDAIGDAPPDYGFDYDQTRLWAWQSDRDAVRYVEAVPDDE